MLLPMTCCCIYSRARQLIFTSRLKFCEEIGNAYTSLSNHIGSRNSNFACELWILHMIIF
jgi:hypothetical protein